MFEQALTRQISLERVDLWLGTSCRTALWARAADISPERVTTANTLIRQPPQQSCATSSLDRRELEKNRQCDRRRHKRRDERSDADLMNGRTQRQHERSSPARNRRGLHPDPAKLERLLFGHGDAL